MSGCNVILETLFPELKESEDEKIKEALIQLVKCNERSGYFVLNNVSTSSMIAWLEKQGEEKPAWSEEDDEIRKALIKGFNKCLVSSSHYPKNAIKYWHGIVIEDILSWLEKCTN